jgi:group I intron endonuclease
MQLEKCSGVYKIRNVTNGKIYVGSARVIKRRVSQHKVALKACKHQNSHLQHAWNKHGAEAFEFSIVLICAPEQLRFYEQRCIDYFAPAYNQSKSAYSGIPLGTVLTDEHKNKVRSASVANWKSLGYREKTVAAIRAAMDTDERAQRVKRTAALWADPEYRSKAVAVRQGNAYNKGYKCTPEQVENRRKAARISNIKRSYGVKWQEEYIRRYPQHMGDINAK